MRFQLLLITLALIFSFVASVEETKSAIAGTDDPLDHALLHADVQAVDEGPLTLESDIVHNNALHETETLQSDTATSAIVATSAGSATATNIKERQYHRVSGIVIVMGGIAIVVLAFVFKKQRGRKQAQDEDDPLRHSLLYHEMDYAAM